MQVACLLCLPARKPLRRFSTQRRFPPFLPCRTPVRSISDTHPVDIGHPSERNRTPFRSHRKTVRHQPGRLSDFNRNAVRFESERCPTSNRIGVRFASEYAAKGGGLENGQFLILSTPRPASSARTRDVSDNRSCPLPDARRSTQPLSSSPPARAPPKPPSLDLPRSERI